MSKLFDTLEKIQNKETFSPATDSLAPPPEQKSGKSLIILVALAVSAVVVFLALQNIDIFKLPRITGKQPVPSTVTQDQASELTENTVSSTHILQQAGQPASNAAQPASANTLNQMTQYNNQGVRLIARSEHWQGIYYFNKAHALSPQSVEPITNLAIALMELGLTAPANRFFREALTIDPDNTILKDNLALAAQLGILDDSLLQLVTGEITRP